MLDEVLFVVSKLFPVFYVLSQINFFSSPECSNLVFVHLPDVIIFDWQDDKSVWVFLQERLSNRPLSVVAVL